jgi:hypothetical protein
VLGRAKNTLILGQKIVEEIVKAVGLVVIAVAAGCAIALLTAWPVMLLWNAIIPGMFGLKLISFVDALYLSLLCGFLFKSSSSSSK